MRSLLTFILLTAIPALGEGAKSALPLFFIPNPGQAPSEVHYMIDTPAFTAGFTSRGAIFKSGGRQVHLQYRGASPATLSAEDALPGHANFLLGNEPAQWHRDLPLYGKIRFTGLYRGIVATYAADGQRIKSEYTVAPGFEPNQLILDYPDSTSILVSQDGNLLVRGEGIEIEERAPIAFQVNGKGREVPVDCRFHLLSPTTVSFELGDYDATKPLIIDPSITYSTYLGGSGITSITSVALDSSTNLYVTGWTDSIDFQINGALEASNRGGVDVFVAKLNANGTALVYATYIGGRSDDRGAGIAVDSSNNAWVTGSTTSSDFPLVSQLGAFGGNRDAFVFRLNSLGNAFVFSTYLGGAGQDQGTAIALDTSGNAYVAGDTTSNNFPVQGAVQSALGGKTDAFLTKFTPSGSILFSTYLGGSQDEHAGAVAVNSSSVYVAGGTFSTNFPVTNPYQAANGGNQDAFVTQIALSGSPIFYSTYLGGNGGAAGNPEQANALAVDSSGNMYVAGVTNSTNFPTTTGAFQTAAGGSQDGFVTKINSSGTTLAYSTYFATYGFDWLSGLAIDNSGNAYLAGYTSGVNFPQVGALQVFKGGYDAIVGKLNPTGNGLLFSTYFGGTGSDQANAIAVDANGNIFVAGQTASYDLTTQSPIQAGNISGNTGWITRMGVSAPPAQTPSVVSVSPTSGSGNTVTFATQYTHSAGIGALTSVSLLVSTTGGTDFSCYVSYNPSNGQFSLANDVVSSGSTAVAVGGTAQNNQCIFLGSGSSASISGSILTVNFSFAFQNNFTGTKGVYLSAADSSTNTGLVAKGAWTVVLPAPQPGADSVAPSSGQGLGQTFAFAFSDTLNPQNLVATAMLISANGSAINACDVIYDRTAGTLSLRWDNFAGQDTKPLGSSTVLQNGQCLIGAGSATFVGLQLVVTLNITFKGTFNGLKNIYLYASEGGSVNTGWVQRGTYLVAAPGFPVANSVVPASGSGPSQRFTITVSDQGGASYITGIAVLISSSTNPNNACNLVFDRTANTVALSYDTVGNGAANLTVGSSQSISNSQCTLNGANTTVFTGPTQVVFTIDLAFYSSFFGTKNVYVYASEPGVNTGYVPLGTWTVTGGAPTADSVSPSSGAGNFPTFTFTVSDSVTAANITGMSMLLTVGAPANVANACYVVYNGNNATVGLYDDTATILSTKTIGSSNNLQNSQCAIGYSVANVAGNSVIFSVGVKFKAPFAGPKTVYLEANEPSTNSGFVARGNWTAQ
jgi:hypothetical protein